MSVQRTVYDPLAIAFAYQEERVRRRLAVPSTQSACSEGHVTKRQEMMLAGQRWKRQMPNTKPPKHSRLTNKDVAEIDRLMRDGGLSMHEIARRFHVHYSTVRDIYTGETWSHITGRRLKDIA